VPCRTLAGAAAITRGDYATVEDADLAFFRSTCGDSGVLTDADDLEKYNEDWLGKWKGKSSVALLPGNTEQVSKVLAYCNERRLAVVPQGGNTGLVGGSIPLFDEVVISTARMNKIRKFDPISGVVTVDAGMVLQELEEYANEQGCMMPIDLGAKGTCTIGGNCATNAGGIRLLRYGSLHGSVMGIEAVLANGEVLDCLSGLRKDNTGYDLKQMFIGSEGSLGLITAVSILAPTAPAAQNVALLACDTFDDVLATFAAAKSGLGEILSAFEFFDNQAMEVTLGHGDGLSRPFETETGFYCLVETSGSNEDHDQEKLMAFLEGVLVEGLAMDGVMAESQTQSDNIWALRETTTSALVDVGHPVFKVCV
jgi:FAD/FMN-containing dehydrogenase